MIPVAGKKKSPLRLSDWLVRVAYLNSLLGVKTFSELRGWLSSVDDRETTDEDGHSAYYHVLIRQKTYQEHGTLPADKLGEYDDNITSHLAKINENRQTPIHLKYYQWLAALFTEAYLDTYFTDGPGKLSGKLEKSLFTFIKEKQTHLSIEDAAEPFIPTRTDFTKCGYWMATGSGKTIIMHLNYLQFLHYNHGPHKKEIDRILLITPNAGLTVQHMRELEKSGLLAEVFDASTLNGYFDASYDNCVSVIEITKLIENKSDNGQNRVDIRSFGTKNLLFVDEAHKGSGKKQDAGWKYLRNSLAKDGWTFEYSATFGQTAADNTDACAAYGKTILFDYSYPKFYEDGYGKEYRILNVNEGTYEPNKVLLANLLTYYEQKLLFEKMPETANEYNIAPPLWILVGNNVTIPDPKKSDPGTKSDVLTTIRFINTFLTDTEWAKQTIQQFLGGTSGLLDKTTSRDIFSPEYPEQRLAYLREQYTDATKIYEDILATIFHCRTPTGITLLNLKNTDGEIGMKCGDNPIFGEIYIGDAAKFLNAIKKFEPEIPIETIDTPSLFQHIDRATSPLNILIGAKKFIEGWDSYRVSCMCLLNVGKSEGPQIIQLFGRGIRLRGKNNSLKRSTNQDGDQPANLPQLETLNIFGINADYIQRLREYFEKDGISTENTIERRIEINIRDDFLDEPLYLPSYKKTAYAQHENFVLTKSDLQGLNISLDLFTRAETEDSHHYDSLKADTSLSPVNLDTRYFEYVNWDRIYFHLLEYKAGRGWTNMIFTQQTLRHILEDTTLYTLYCEPNRVTNLRSFQDIEELEKIITLLLKKILHAAYSRKQNRWIRENSNLCTLSLEHENFATYTVRIKESETEVLNSIETICSDLKSFIHSQHPGKFITNVYCERHLFQPLLTKSDKNTEKFSITPTGLNDGEEKFVTALQNFINDETNHSYFETKRIYLLRNLPKHGVGFYQTTWFYPDFIMWIIDTTTNTQRIVFVDPKGVVHLSGFNDEKIQLAKTIKDMEKELNKKSGKKPISMDSYIISVTSRTGLSGVFGTGTTLKDYEENHLLFIDDSQLIEKILGT